MGEADMKDEPVDGISLTENKVKNIISSRMNENSWIDYKISDYTNNEKGKMEQLKDVIAMLNSKESFGKDKFIIFGVVDRTLYPKGIDSNMRDDNEFQNVFDLIKPRPIIETGRVENDRKIFGYIHIGSQNIQRPYTVKSEDIYPEGTSFIRVGSTNRGLPDVDRQEFIVEQILNRKESSKVIQKIELNNQMKLNDYTAKNFIGEKIINPSLNNGQFVIGTNEYLFNIKFQAASNHIARIYDDLGINHGKATFKIKFEESSAENIDLNEIDFSSRVVEYTVKDIAVIVNEYGKILVLKFTEIGSRSHGALQDKLVFHWKILSDLRT